jgi:hypothetical protein
LAFRNVAFLDVHVFILYIRFEFAFGLHDTSVYPKVSGLSHNDIYAYLRYYSLRSNTKGYGGKTH